MISMILQKICFSNINLIFYVDTKSSGSSPPQKQRPYGIDCTAFSLSRNPILFNLYKLFIYLLFYIW